MSIKEHPPHHVPVLLESSIDLLNPIKGENYLDLTAGYGGHAKAFLERTDNYTESCLVDRDSFAIAELSGFEKQGVRLLHMDFVSAAHELVQQSRQFNLILLDLGVSSPQLDRSERGFSFTKNGPLDMRMDNRQELTAANIVNRSSVDDLTQIIVQYGEETRGTARRYAKAIVKNRPFSETEYLAETIKQSHVGRWQKIHPATRTFQAIRIAVNQELRQVEEVLTLLPRLLSPGGRVGVISFHSLEDRLVKRYFAEQAKSGYEAELTVITKKPICGDTHDVHNPRARSAKLRVAVKK